MPCARVSNAVERCQSAGHEFFAERTCVGVAQGKGDRHAAARETGEGHGLRSLDPALGKQVCHDPIGQGGEAHPLHPRPDRRQEGIANGTEQNEVRSRPRLLECLQQCVRGRGAELFRAPDDKHLRPSFVWREGGVR